CHRTGADCAAGRSFCDRGAVHPVRRRAPAAPSDGCGGADFGRSARRPGHGDDSATDTQRGTPAHPSHGATAGESRAGDPTVQAPAPAVSAASSTRARLGPAGITPLARCLPRREELMGGSMTDRFGVAALAVELALAASGLTQESPR